MEAERRRTQAEQRSYSLDAAHTVRFRGQRKSRPKQGKTSFKVAGERQVVTDGHSLTSPKGSKEAETALAADPGPTLV